MKKLKVILPAILTLTVSTSAAVTGTVAWFTATRLRTVAMEGITVVNPEAGLDVVSVTNVANTKVDGVNPNFTVKHLKTTDGSKNLLMRDASVNTSNGTVFRAVLNDETEAQPTSYVAATEDKGTNFKYQDNDGKTYNGLDIVYATKFDATFKSSKATGGAETFNYCLFLDIKQSSVKIKNDAAAYNAALNKALRIGLKYGETSEWFVWAPNADTVSAEAAEGVVDDTVTAENWAAKLAAGLYTDEACTSAATGGYVDGTYYVKNPNKARYVSATDTLTSYNAANFIQGNAAEGTGAQIPAEDTNGNIAKATAEAYAGYLGVLDAVGVAVHVTTWFEGSDPNCINANFGGSLDDITSNLKFVMRRVATA